MSGGGYDLSGIGILVVDCPAALARRVEAAWSAYASSSVDRPLLTIDVDVVDRPYPAGEYLPKQMQVTYDSGLVNFGMPEGSGVLAPDGKLQVALVRLAGEDRHYFTILNMVRAGLAHRIASRGGAFLHAAGVVIDGRGFVLTGAANAGKSTWARLAEQGGARVISDDVVLLDRDSDDRLELLASPFRSTHEVEDRPGRWPLAAILHPEHATAAALRPLTGLGVHARIVANLPFVSQRLGAARVRRR